MTRPAQFFTTPIYYVNAKPHLGHAYTTIAADVATRFKQMDGYDTYFLTGTDEHGDKIVQAAEKENCSPKEYVDQISRLFQDLWPVLNISNNQFIRTTNPGHIKVVEQILTRIHDSGDIYFSSYEGLYCFGCERFYQERELTDGKCPDHGTAPEVIKESNYFFKMSQYQDWLIDHIKANPDFIRPEQYKKEILSFLKEPLEDLCISRPKTRLTWGITLPFDKDYVTYVWFDALVNYISALGFPDGDLLKQFWPTTRHFVAKDIIKPHGIYWPIMLKAAGLDIYKGLNVHGFWNVRGSKMSKSIGNVTDPVEVTAEYGVDPFRYFLMREMVFGRDANFTEDQIVTRINSDLANDLGNLFSRVLTMTNRSCPEGFSNQIPELAARETEYSLKDSAQQALDEFKLAMDQCEFHNGTAAVWSFISLMNKYIDTREPWALAKDETKRQDLELVLYNLVEGLRVVACLIYPVMPDTAKKMQAALGLNTDNNGLVPLHTIMPWGQTAFGTGFEKPAILFPRIEEKPKETEPVQAKPFKPALKDQISIEDFSKVDLRTGTILSAQKVENSSKLLKLIVDLGVEKRQIIAGIGKTYSPESLTGKQVIVVANLKEAKIMGEVSQGMVLAVKDKKNLVLSGVESQTANGKPVQ